jgi:hypothetical protein
MKVHYLLRTVPALLLSLSIPGMALAKTKAKASPSPSPEAAVASPSPSAAAEATTGATKKGRSPETTAKGMLTRLKNQVGLTADQEAKAKPIVEKYASDRAAIRNDASLDSAAKNQKFTALRTQYVSDIKSILTPAQQTKLASAQAANRERLKAGREKRKAGAVAASPSPSPKQ